MEYHPEVVQDTCRAENKNKSNQGMHNCTTSESTTTHERPCARTEQTNMVRAAELPASSNVEGENKNARSGKQHMVLQTLRPADCKVQNKLNITAGTKRPVQDTTPVVPHTRFAETCLSLGNYTEPILRVREHDQGTKLQDVFILRNFL